jgi:hypothetical protein
MKIYNLCYIRGDEHRDNAISTGVFLSIYLSIYLSMVLQPFFRPWPLFQFLNLNTVGSTPWTRDQAVTRPLPTHRTTQTQNKRAQTSTIPLFERVKTVHALDRDRTL